MGRCDQDVLEGTHRLIERVWHWAPRFGTHGATTAEISAALVGLRVDLRTFPFRSATVGMAMAGPDGAPLILMDSRADRVDWDLAIRHEIAHVLADEVEHALFLSAADTMSYSERRADLFALVDLLPTPSMAQLPREGGDRDLALIELLEVVRPSSPGWSALRRWDRVELRMGFHASFGI